MGGAGGSDYRKELALTAPQPPRCSLGRLIAEPIDAETVKRDGWREQGILVVAREDSRLNLIEREFVRLLGEKLYGNRDE